MYFIKIEVKMDIFSSWLVNKYIAHRGLHSDKIPENSIMAFKEAINHDYAIELDVHKIEDDTVVVFHDDTLKRMTGEDGYINSVKDKKELKKFNLLDTNEKIPTLKEVLKEVDGKVPLLIEIKDFNLNPTLPQLVYEDLKNYKGEVAVISFNPYAIEWFYKNAPDVKRGILSSYFKGIKLGFHRKNILKKMKLNKICLPNFIVYKYDEVPNRFVKKYKELPLITFAVPTQEAYMKVAKHCDNIIFEGFLPRI